DLPLMRTAAALMIAVAVTASATVGGLSRAHQHGQSDHAHQNRQPTFREGVAFHDSYSLCMIPTKNGVAARRSAADLRCQSQTQAFHWTGDFHRVRKWELPSNMRQAPGRP